MRAFLIIMFSIIHSFPNYLLGNSGNLLSENDGWLYLLVDNNYYSYSNDTGCNEYAIYFIGNKYSEIEIKKTVLKINSIYKSENKYIKLSKKEHKKKGLSTIGGLNKFIERELVENFSNRAVFDELKKESRDAFNTLTHGEMIATYYFKNGFFGIKEDSTAKKYILVKHYFK